MSIPLLVADSGPLIALVRLDLLHLPGCYFESTLVTTTIWDEVTRNPKPLETDRLQASLAAGRFRLVDDVLSSLDSQQSAGIDVGEQSAIALALALPAELLIDDRRARRAAQLLGVSTLGTLGLLVRARQDGLISPLRPLLTCLSDTGYFLSSRLIDQVLGEVGE